MIAASQAEAATATMALADEAARVRLAASVTTSPALLRQLADDPAVVVRAAVAMNRACGPDADRILTADDDERVRALLAERVARLLPGLPTAERSRAAVHVCAILAALVDDEAVRVRIVITEAVKAMPNAPRDLVLRLAHDPALPVSDPVIRLSPLLTDADLLALLTTPPRALAATSVAGRAGLSAAVADAVVAQGCGPAIRTLLANHSAAIQEATLDALVDRAARHADWHEPLVRRPCLSAKSARALSVLVTAQQLELLARRTDLDPAIAAELLARLAWEPEAAAVPGLEGDEAVLASVRRLSAADALNEAALLDAARMGNHRHVAAIIAVASGVPLPAIDRAASRRNAKALVSLAWKAGFTMRAGGVVQAMLGQLGPGKMLTPTANGAYPLSPDEMEWQIEVLSEAGR